MSEHTLEQQPATMLAVASGFNDNANDLVEVVIAEPDQRAYVGREIAAGAALTVHIHPSVAVAVYSVDGCCCVWLAHLCDEPDLCSARWELVSNCIDESNPALTVA